MQSSNIPSGIQLPFANAGSKQTIPVASQIGIVNGRASYTDGFPPLTRTPVAAGGVPPFGTDMNGILFAISAIQQWQTAGGMFTFNSAWSTANGGYPKGAVIASSTFDGYWVSLVENNTTDPDAAANVNWSPVDTVNITTIPLTNANVALTPAQYKNRFIVLTGTLTGNVQLTFPKIVNGWRIINSTTGAFAITALTSGGTAVSIAAGTTDIRGDGTNVLVDQIPRDRQVFTASGTFIVPAGVYTVWLSAAAGGGGGGGSAGSNGTANSAGGGGGGGAGQSAQRTQYSVTPGQSISVTIGTAGALGNGGASGANNGSPGGTGGSTIIGAPISLTLSGGVGGGGGASGAGGAGGNGGTGSPSGSCATDGGANGGGGAGASSPFGGGGGSGRGGLGSGVAGTQAVGYGSGGGGGGAAYNAVTVAGTNGNIGAQGIAIFEW